MGLVLYVVLALRYMAVAEMCLGKEFVYDYTPF